MSPNGPEQTDDNTPGTNGSYNSRKDGEGERLNDIGTMKSRYVVTVIAKVIMKDTVYNYLSLNVCGLRSKFIDPHLINIINNYGIIGLQKTKTNCLDEH